MEGLQVQSVPAGKMTGALVGTRMKGFEGETEEGVAEGY